MFSGAWLPGLCSADEGGKEGAREGILRVGALGMPLHRNNPMIGRSELDGFDHVVFGRDSSDAEIVAGSTNGLVMAGVDQLRAERTSLHAGLLVQRAALRA